MTGDAAQPNVAQPNAVRSKAEKRNAPRIEHEHWSPEMVTEFKRRQRGRNWALLAVLAGFCVLIYAIAVVKLHEYGQMW